MREFAKFSTAFWTSPTIQALSDDGKLLAAYLICGPHSNQAGVYRLPDGYVSGDLGWDAERVSKRFGELSRNGFASRCETTFWVLINKAFKHHKPANPNQELHVQNILSQIPSNCTIRPLIAQCIKEYWPTVPKPLIEVLNNKHETVSEQNTKEEKEKEKEKERKACAEPQSVSPPFILIPLVAKQGEFTVTEAMVMEWVEAYPGIDVRQQLRNIRQWNLVRPKRRKTRHGVLAHITGWLANEQNGRPNVAASINPPPAKTCEYAEPGQPACGMVNAEPSELYGGRPICSHHATKLRGGRRAQVTPVVQEQLRAAMTKGAQT